ncbi:MAG TPA: MBL fold metallo-hydrolase [Candidatus Bilamarchaeum sp.]|nr:MBL fold metallo-hydrolase [Candidatus Bilamarchaeum sp.]
MEIVFLGTGGGRINLLKQVRGTGGFRINSKSANIHVDPGPGALLHSLKNGQDPMKLDAVVVSHNHTDHVTDARVLIEGMTGYALKKRGILIASKVSLDPQEGGIGRFHLGLVPEVYSAVFREKKEFRTEKGSFTVEIFPMKHEEPSTFGFKLSMDGAVLGYISDTEYDEGFGKDFAGCDLLLINCLKPESDRYAGHLTSSGAIKILKEARPNSCVITHLGMKMLQIGPAKEAERIERESGVKTVAAKDGMKIRI